MYKNHDILQDIGVSHPKLDQIVEICHAGGALGAKLTGAGGGGCAICLCRDKDIPNIRARLKHVGITNFSAEISYEGFKKEMIEKWGFIMAEQHSQTRTWANANRGIIGIMKKKWG